MQHWRWRWQPRGRAQSAAVLRPEQPRGSQHLCRTALQRSATVTTQAGQRCMSQLEVMASGAQPRSGQRPFRPGASLRRISTASATCHGPGATR